MIHQIINSAIEKLVPKIEYQYQSRLANIIGDNRQRIQHMFMNTTHIKGEIEEIIEQMNQNKESIKKGITGVKDIVESDLFSIKIKANFIIVANSIETANYYLSKCKEVFDFLDHKASSGTGKNKKQLINSEKHYSSLKHFYDNIKRISNFIEIIKKDFYKTIENIKSNHRKNTEIDLLFEDKVTLNEKEEEVELTVPDISVEEISENINEYLKEEYDYITILCTKIMTQWFIKEKEKLFKLYKIVEKYYTPEEEDEYDEYDNNEYDFM